MPWNQNANNGSGRWINDAPQHRFSAIGGFAVVLAYRRAAREGGHGRKLCSRFAIFDYERRTWHAGYSLDPNTEGAWMTSERIDAQPERLERLLSATFRRKISLDEIEKADSAHELLWLWMQEKRKNKLLSKKEKLVFKAFDNYCRVVGGIEDQANRGEILSLFFGRPTTKVWLQYERGRDLFIFDRFDISRVLREAIDNLNTGRGYSTMATSWSPELNYEGLYSYVISPGYLIVQGSNLSYNTRWLFEPRNEKGHAILTHLRRNRNVWRNEEFRNRLDELAHGAYMVENLLLLQEPPQRVLAEIAENRERIAQHQPQPRYELQINLSQEELARLEKTAEEQRMVAQAGPELTFNTFDYKSATYGELELRVVNNKGHLEAVAKALNNCAAHYAYQLWKGEQLFVSAWHMEEPVALGSVVLNEGKIADKRWNQLSGRNNRKTTEAVKKAYKDYLDANLGIIECK